MPPEQSTKKKAEEHPSGDDRYLAIDRTMKLFAHESDALLEVLNTAQEAFGYLSEDLLIYVSRHLKVPLSRVYGVATFYHMFTFSPLASTIASSVREQPVTLKAQTRFRRLSPKNSASEPGKPPPMVFSA